MPSSAAIAAAVTGWSPVIMIGADAGAAGASRTACARLGARRIDHADQAERTRAPARSRSESSPASASRATAAGGDAQRAQRLRAPAVHVGPRISARRSGVSGRVPLADQLLGAAREQHVGRALGEDERRAGRSLGVGVDGAHQLALGGERHLARRARSARRSARRRARPCAPRRSARPRSGRPAPSSGRRCSCSTALFARSAAASARSTLGSAGSVDGPPPPACTSPAGA